MKSLGFASILVLSLTIPPAMAQSASGTYRFILEDDAIKSLDFQADERGGSMTFTDEAKISDDDVEDPRAGDPMEIYVKADLSGVTVEKNRALMNGIVVDSNHVGYIGRWVQLVVEDNAENPRLPDRLTWNFCKRSERGGWVPSDSERKDDDGAYLRWWATDAERDDDKGIPSVNLLGDDAESCPVQSVWLYDFAGVSKWDGDIVVRP